MHYVRPRAAARSPASLAALYLAVAAGAAAIYYMWSNQQSKGWYGQIG